MRERHHHREPWYLTAHVLDHRLELTAHQSTFILVEQLEIQSENAHPCTECACSGVSIVVSHDISQPMYWNKLAAHQSTVILAEQLKERTGNALPVKETVLKPVLILVRANAAIADRIDSLSCSSSL